MREPRNPFRLRTAERIESDATFLRLFGPGALDLLPAEQPWGRVQFLRSAPGGGKTSLMRVFTPDVLLTLHAYRSWDECKDLYLRMKDLGVIDESGPRLLGAHLSLARNYATLADMRFEPAYTERLFYGLLNARIILAVLRGALALRRLTYPRDLDRLYVAPAGSAGAPLGVTLPCDGPELYRRATTLELTVCRAIDSLGFPHEASPTSDGLPGLTLLSPASLIIDGAPVAEHLLLMLDDVHKVAPRQRDSLVQAVVDLRSPIGVWVAERFEALSTDEMLSQGATQGRDYGEVILLETFWRTQHKRFQQVVLNIADRRARTVTDVEIDSFGSHLQEGLDATEWEQRYARACDVVAARVRRLAGAQSLFQQWIASSEVRHGTPRQRAVAWRTVEILIERERRKKQLRFDFGTEFALPPEDLIDKDDAAARAAAELFLAHEFELPYYFGAGTLARLASSNIEQFLALAGDEFEEIVSAALLRRPIDLPPDRQEALVKRAAQIRWNELPRRVPNGRQVRDFLEAVGTFAHWVTHQPNAPYSPGVTGIAISMADRERLRHPKNRTEGDYAALASVLAAAIAHNFLEPILDYQCKGERWMVLNLNRLLCVRFGLPLHYGGWREKRLSELVEWLSHGFPMPKKVDLQ